MSKEIKKEKKLLNLYRRLFRKMQFYLFITYTDYKVETLQSKISIDNVVKDKFATKLYHQIIELENS